MSDPDDMDADHPGLHATLRAVEPSGDDRPRSGGFKGVRDSLSITAVTCALDGCASSLISCAGTCIPMMLRRQPKSKKNRSPFPSSTMMAVPA